LISVTGGDDRTMFDLDEAASRIRQEVDDETNIILGATFEPSLDGVVRVSVVATGFDRVAVANTHVETEPLPVPLSHSQSPLSGAGLTRPTADCWRD
jgi:cell division protein FtsZ